MLQSSGLIKFSDIRTELGVAEQTPFRLNQAEENTYVYINDCSSSKPDESVTSRLNEWYSYNHSSSCCSYTLTGSYSGNDYVLKNYYLYVKNKTSGDQINFICYALDRPNRFNVYDIDNNLLATSGWKGTASYAGPWGGSLSDSTPAIFNLTYTPPVTSTDPDYVLKVESGPADTGSPISDAWEVSMSCSTPPPPPAPPECGDTLNGTYEGNDYTLQEYTLDLTGATDGYNVTLACNSVERPDRFTVYDNLGNLVGTSGWVGTASYAGPWGSSLSNTGTYNLVFTYDAAKTYELRVDVGPADPSSPVSDAWEVTLSCSAPPPPPTPTPTPTPTPPSIPCGGYYSGTYAGNDFTIQTHSLDLSGVFDGETISVACNSLDRPNRFSIYDDLILSPDSSGWLGTASYSGPWGISLSNSGSYVLTFTYDSARTYELRVDIGPADPSNPISDAWEATVSCGTLAPPAPTPTPTPTPTPVPESHECLCYSLTYDPATLPSDLYVRYRQCYNVVTTQLITNLISSDNGNGTYTAHICVQQGDNYATPVCVVDDGINPSFEVSCDPYSWVSGGSCTMDGDCESP